MKMKFENEHSFKNEHNVDENELTAVTVLQTVATLCTRVLQSICFKLVMQGHLKL